MALTGFAIGVAAVAWAGLIAGCVAWLSILLPVLALGRALVPLAGRLPDPSNGRLGTSKESMNMGTAYRSGPRSLAAPKNQLTRYDRHVRNRGSPLGHK